MAKKKRVAKINPRTGRPMWIRGIDMPEFSDKSWKELEDIWPREIRLSSEAWKILSVILPAYQRLKVFMKVNLGDTIHLRQLLMLAYIQRCEEAKSNVATESYPVLKGVNMGFKIFGLEKAKLTKLGLIETLPSGYLRLYRVTEMGKLLIRTLVENIEQGHADVRFWISQQPEENIARVDEYLKKYCQ